MLIPTLYLPGLLCDSVLWHSQIEALRDLSAPAIADLTLDSTVEDMARRALAAAPERFALVALSMGGYVAFEIMRQAPERVLRLALFDTSASPDSPRRAMERKAGIDSLQHGRFRGVTDRLLTQLIHAQHIGGDVDKTVKEMAARVGANAFLRQQTAILQRPDSRPTLQGIKVPTLVVVGDDDRLTPAAEAQTIHEGIAGSSFHILDRCGHLPALETPVEVSKLLRMWLGQ